MQSAIIAVAALAPLIASVLVVATRATGLVAGRIAAAGCGVATLAAVGLVAIVAADDDGRTGSFVGIGADRVSALLLVAVTGTGAVVAGFSRRNVDDESRTTGYFALLGLVVAASALVVLPGGPIALGLGWLVSGWALTALIGWQPGWSMAERARKRIRSTLAVGDIALVTALVVLGLADATRATTGDPSATESLAGSSIFGIESTHVFALLVVLAGASRSALLPFHRWLVGTLAAPTPVSALVHAGLVSGAGLLLIRFSAPFVASDIAVVAAFALGTATILAAAGATAMRSDVKGALAWSTVGQMAFMVVQCAVGAFSSAVFHIIGHGMYKATLFLGAGDTVSAGIRNARRPSSTPISPTVRWTATLVVTTALVGLGLRWITPEVSDAGTVLIAVFAWLSTAAALYGWIGRSPFAPALAIASGAGAAAAGVVAYLAGLRLLERFVSPSFADTPSDTVIGPVAVGITVGLIAAGIGAVAVWPGRMGLTLRTSLQHRVDAIATEGLAVAARMPRPTSADTGDTVPDSARAAQIRADVARAGRIIAPLWPLSSFVAVNPVGGLEVDGFDRAARDARRWLRGRTHLSLAQYRTDLAGGLITVDNLAEAIHLRFMELCSRTPMLADGRMVGPEEIILADLLHGPEAPEAPTPRTALERLSGSTSEAVALVDDVMTKWLTSYVNPPTWSFTLAGESFTAMAVRRSTADASLGRALHPGARTWLRSLDENPASVIDTAFASMQVDDDARVAEMRGHLASIAGWSGHAKWRTEWAQPDETRPLVSPIEIVAVRAMLEAAVAMTVRAEIGGQPPHPDGDTTQADAARHLDARVSSVTEHLGLHDVPALRSDVTELLAAISEADRAATWLTASELNLDQRLLAMLDRPDTDRRVTLPDTQLVFCIDVRSEGLRRHLEAHGRDETIGFAGFFGVPMRIRQAGWERPEARCPVLVSPGVDATERPDPDAVTDLARQLRRSATAGGVQVAHAETKHVVGASFVAAETLGWLLGPLAAAKTFLSRPRRRLRRATTTVQFDDTVLVEQRVFLAESVLNTMGLTQSFAPLVALCGHTSATTNNAHATALECGACAGASGEGNARAVATLLNSPDVRIGLRDRGINIPDDTWFIAGLHDTVSDHVELLDTAHAPASHRQRIEELRRRLLDASRTNVADRAPALPGPAGTAHARGADWAQVRPEWGLARNAAFIIGPRAMTHGLDLGGRAFLHSYDSDNDPTGKVLETIMTAPLVVGHWISSQYYFSTVDPDVFGAGDKLLHNPVGTLGVLSGDGGDLRVGLPLQSTHVAGRRHHQPVRLLAVIQAEPARIEEIIDANPILQTLTGGSWIRIAARSHPDEPWSTRTPHGTWITTPAALRAQRATSEQTAPNDLADELDQLSMETS